MKQFLMMTTVLASIALNAPALYSAGRPEQSDSMKDARKMAMITAARQINVAEVDQQMATGSFGDWNVLARSKSIQKQDLQVPLKVEVRVFAAADGKHFSVVLKDTQDPSLYTVSAMRRESFFRARRYSNARVANHGES